MSFMFFFFQAEDGIRDLTVTGVQTCALPSSSAVKCGHASTALPERGVRKPYVQGRPVRFILLSFAEVVYASVPPNARHARSVLRRGCNGPRARPRESGTR